MSRASRPHLRRVRLLVALAVIAGVWIMIVVPALAQGEQTPPASMTERFFKQPDLVAPLVVPMILALGGILTLMAFLAWAFKRLPEE